MSKYLRVFCTYVTVLIFAASGPAQTAAKPAAKPDYSKEAAVGEMYFTKVTFENDGTSTRESTTRIRVQSDAGVQQYGLLVFSYQSSSENLDIDYVRVHKPDGAVVETPADSTQDMAAEISRQAPMYSDQREKHLAVRGLGSGDVLEFRLHWKGTKPLVPGQFWFAYNFSHDGIVLQEQLQISVPHDRTVKWKSPEMKPVITEEAGRRVFTWTGTNLERKTSDQEEKDQEKASYQSVRGIFPAPEVQISSFQSWEEVGRWYSSLQQEKVQPGPEVRAKAAELTKGAVDDDAKIRALYNYVSTQYRYIGIAFGLGRFQPHSATEVLSNQYGDCKDKHTLLASLLQAVGITAYPALVSSGAKLDPDVPSVSQFNHVITVLPRGSNYLWLDTTPELAPLAYLLPQLRDKQALVIPNDHTPLWVTIPADPPFQGSSVFKAEGKLSQTGVLDAQMQQTLRGDLEILIRTVFRRVPQAQWKNLVQQISFGAGFGGTVSEVVASSPETTESPFHFSYDYNRKDYSDWENRRITPPFPPMSMPALRDDQTSFASPLWLGAPGESAFEANVTMPDGYSPDLPAAVDVKRDFAEYHASYELKNGVLTAKRRLILRLREVPVSEFAEYKSFRKALEDEQNRYIVLAAHDSSSTSEPDTAAADPVWSLPDSDNPEALRAESRVHATVEAHDLPGTISALKHAVAVDPKFTRSWVLLGRVYMASGKIEESVDAFQKAVDSDPDLPLPRKMLAFALNAAHRPDDAIKAWQELLKTTPQDHEAATTLGDLLISRKRSGEAIALLESAAKEGPDSSALQMSLGYAYLLSGSQEKGMAAFSSALKLSPGARLKNSVAYTLAEADVGLPEALQYGKDAVKEEEDASRTIHLDKLDVFGLEHTNNLAAYWDTLGWLYFKMSNYPQAEEYLSSAWDLSQYGPIADHLGQVYEQEGKSEAAAGMYRLALDSDSHLAETQKRLDHVAPRPKPNGNSSGADLSQMRTIKLVRLVEGSASAEFFLLFAPGPKLEEVKFIRGSEKLRTANKTLSTSTFHMPFPTESNARIVRRGILGCYPSSGCALVLLAPGLVRSVN